MKIDIMNNPVLKSCLKPISEISIDTSKNPNEVLVDLPYLIVSFDDVVKKIMINYSKSCDGFWNFKTKEATFIEFKNGAFGVDEILNKYKYSVDVMNKNFSSSNNDYKFILVYNSSFIVKKDNNGRNQIKNILLSKSNTVIHEYYTERINKIKMNILNSDCFDSKCFINFVNIEY